MSKPRTSYRRPQAAVLAERLAEPRRFLQIVAGPRQVGKSTLVQQVTDELSLPVRFVSADEPTLRGPDWISQQWEAARLEVSGKEGAVLVLDEIQKIPAWSETVKRLWDEDTRKKRPLKVVLLGSAPLLIAQGLTESLAGRFETLRLPHWSYAEMRDAFGWKIDQYLTFGGYPGAAPLIRDPIRWSRYIADSLIETSIARDVLLLTRVAYSYQDTRTPTLVNIGVAVLGTTLMAVMAAVAPSSDRITVLGLGYGSAQLVGAVVLAVSVRATVHGHGARIPTVAVPILRDVVATAVAAIGVYAAVRAWSGTGTISAVVVCIVGGAVLSVGALVVLRLIGGPDPRRALRTLGGDPGRVLGSGVGNP